MDKQLTVMLAAAVVDGVNADPNHGAQSVLVRSSRPNGEPVGVHLWPGYVSGTIDEITEKFRDALTMAAKVTEGENGEKLMKLIAVSIAVNENGPHVTNVQCKPATIEPRQP